MRWFDGGSQNRHIKMFIRMFDFVSRTLLIHS
jgi:hypothetical protein